MTSWGRPHRAGKNASGVIYYVYLLIKSINEITKTNMNFINQKFKVVCFALKFVERRFTSFHIFNYLM